MTDFQLGQVKQGTLGNDAGWALSFHKIQANGDMDNTPELEISSRDYYASIDATLPEGLAGGSYTIKIEALTDEHYGKIKPVDDTQRLAVKLYLFWRDVASVTGYFTNFVGLNAGPSGSELEQSLIAVLYVKSVTRKNGAKVYETEIKGQELAFWTLSNKRVAETFSAATFRDAITAIRTRTNVPFATWEILGNGHMTPGTGDSPGEENVEFGRGLQFSAAVQRIANALEEGLQLFGRKMVLIRDGTVHMGKRPIPYPEGPAKRMSHATGQLETVEDEPTEGDGQGSSEVPPSGGGTRQPTFTLTCKGRPDIKPGDVVEFDRPPRDFRTLTPGVGEALLGAFAAPFLPSMDAPFAEPTLMYVTSVQHKLGKASGFATFVKGVKIPSLAEAWDRRAAGPSAPAPSPQGPAGPAATAADAVRRVVRQATGANRTIEVAEVRSVATNASGAVEPPAQTETLWEGTVARDGRANGARRLAINRAQASSLTGTPYLTPFAWGKCGLVLPRYPGTRVAVGFRNGQADDPIDLGAVWQSGHGPVSNPGDWWLSLPVDVASSQLSSVPDTTQQPTEHTGKVTNDLTDATGKRFIEVGELTIRVGKDALGSAGTRPPASSTADSITIEHTKEHSKIVMKQDGSIEITGKNITIDAGSNGTITMKAKTVDVQVGTEMNVH